MRRVKWVSVAAVVLILFAVSCATAPTTSPSPTPTPVISEEKAIAIAATQVPLAVVERSSVYSSSSGRIIFAGANTTREELGWEEDGKTTFEWSGGVNSPYGVYASVMVSVNVSTGEINRRLATNAYFLAEPVDYPITVVNSGWSCTRPAPSLAPSSAPSPNPTPAISKEEAIAIAATQVPLAVAQRCVLRADIMGGSPWRIIFDRVNTTRDELNWTDDGHTRFDPGGGQTATPGQFVAVMVSVNSSNGMIEQRLATNGVFLDIPPP